MTLHGSRHSPEKHFCNNCTVCDNKKHEPKRNLTNPLFKVNYQEVDALATLSLKSPNGGPDVVF